MISNFDFYIELTLITVVFRFTTLDRILFYQLFILLKSPENPLS